MAITYGRHDAAHRQSGVYYSRAAVSAYDDLVKLGLRIQSKELASDHAVVQREVPDQTRSISVRELRSELELIAKSKDANL